MHWLIQHGSQAKPFDGIAISLPRRRAGEEARRGPLLSNATQILCLWHVSSHSWVISQRTFRVCRGTQSHVRMCVCMDRLGHPQQGPLTVCSCREPTVIVTQRKPFTELSFLRFFLCTAQLAACRARLHCAAGPGTLHTPEAPLATVKTASLFIQKKKIP